MLEAAKEDGFALNDRDVIAVTEAVVARAQGNYATVDNIASDIRSKYGDNTIGVIFPILSRKPFCDLPAWDCQGREKNRPHALPTPSDEVGNHLVSLDQVEEKGVNPWSDVLTLEQYRELFGVNLHPLRA